MSQCVCEFDDYCDGSGVIYCAGCGGEICVCAACCGNGEIECPGCSSCEADDYDEEWL